VLEAVASTRLADIAIENDFVGMDGNEQSRANGADGRNAAHMVLEMW
jgi:hypothetical protein